MMTEGIERNLKCRDGWPTLASSKANPDDVAEGDAVSFYVLDSSWGNGRRRPTWGLVVSVGPKVVTVQGAGYTHRLTLARWSDYRVSRYEEAS